jgi:hypothetical protein
MKGFQGMMILDPFPSFPLFKKKIQAGKIWSSFTPLFLATCLTGINKLQLNFLSTAPIRKRKSYSYRNRGILTVGLKNETVEIVGIIFPHPQPPKPTVLEIMFCCQNLVVGSPGDFGSFRQTNRTESENLDYVLRGKKACVRCAGFWERPRASE